MTWLILLLWSAVVAASAEAFAVAGCSSAAAAALGFSYYRVPIMLKVGMPAEEDAFAVRECTPAAKGLGLFACRSFDAGDLVIEYRGDVISWRGLAERYGTGTINLQGKYVFELRRDGSYIDAGDEASSSVGIARYINHSGRRPNLLAQVDLLHSRVWFEAARNIRAGDELCFDYGERYWEGWTGDLFDD